MKMLVSGTTPCSENWADYSWAELNNVCFMDMPWHMRYFDVILNLLFVVSVILMSIAITIYYRNKEKRLDYHRYLWFGATFLVVTLIFGLWVLIAHSTPNAVITSIYGPIVGDGLFLLSPDGVGLVYERTLSIILIFLLLLTSQLAWIVILLRDPCGSDWMAVQYQGITRTPTQPYKFKIDGRKREYKKSELVFISKATFYLCHYEDEALIELSLKPPTVAHTICRSIDGKWSVTPQLMAHEVQATYVLVDKVIQIPESDISITLERQW